MLSLSNLSTLQFKKKKRNLSVQHDITNLEYYFTFYLISRTKFDF